MSRKVFISLMLLSALLALPVLAFAAGTNQAAQPVTVTLDALNSSGQTGTATLTDMGGGQVKVDIVITGEPAGASEPVHIHSGQCGSTLGAVVFPLSPVVDGKSTTTISTTMATLQDGNHAVNGHKSAAEIQTYVFCGNIAAAAAAQTTTTATTAATAAATATTAATAAATPTTAATAAATATTAATAAAPAATSTAAAPSTLPTTGGDMNNLVLPVFILGIIAIGAGLLLRRTAARQ